ncbi:MAG: glycosyltransferase [Candidatus Rokubacteria bacterium]|nr:glycosyltransferase [Candidatus Rokubacteria bacterium]
MLANSGHEPFGLVGLEAMASGAVVMTGGTGEDYAIHLENGIVLETADPAEASWYVRFLKEHPEVSARIGATARRAARRFLWNRAVENLLGKVEFLAARQGALPAEPAPAGLDAAGVEPPAADARSALAAVEA